jgi:adenylyl-sulfate kinase
MKEGFVVWLTGLPGSGKTTIARELEPELKKRGWCVEVLDGDEIRQNLSKGLGFSREDRETHLKRVTYVAKLLSRNGVAVIAAFISPYRNIREYARRETTNFLEVYVKCSVEGCARRDPKGLYKKASAGEIKNLTGPQDLYEEPTKPDLVIDTERLTVQQSVDSVLAMLKQARPNSLT